jgi:GDP-D-glucose phosphorylase
MSAGCFKYNLDSMKTKILPGSYKLVAQLNEKRFTQRRKPQQMTSVSQPFDDTKFNFTKVPNKEVQHSVCVMYVICTHLIAKSLSGST